MCKVKAVGRTITEQNRGGGGGGVETTTGQTQCVCVGGGGRSGGETTQGTKEDQETFPNSITMGNINNKLAQIS